MDKKVNIKITNSMKNILKALIGKELVKYQCENLNDNDSWVMHSVGLFFNDINIEVINEQHYYKIVEVDDYSKMHISKLLSDHISLADEEGYNVCDYKVNAIIKDIEIMTDTIKVSGIDEYDYTICYDTGIIFKTAMGCIVFQIVNSIAEFIVVSFDDDYMDKCIPVCKLTFLE